MPPLASRRHGALFQWLATLLAPVTLLFAFAFRAEQIEAVAGAYTSCTGCFRWPVYGQDAWVLALVFAMFAIGCSAPPRSVRLVARLVAVLICALAIADIALIALLAQRLHVDDIVRFGGDVAANWSVVRASLSSPTGAAVGIGGLAWLLILAIACRPSPRHPVLGAVFGICVVPCCAFALYTQTTPVRYVHSTFVDNVLETNLPQGRVREYSPAFIARQRDIVSRMPELCTKAAATTHPDVIVLLVESLSAWHSALLGGPQDWTPRLDAIARENHYFTHFYANGFTTSGGEISLITGRVPFNPPGAITLQFDHYAVREGALPEIARKSGYESAFFTSGDTGFLHLGDLLTLLGFDTINGAEDAYYEGHPRGQFGAAEDRVFYDRFLLWLDQRARRDPFVAYLLTVTSHPPFLDPRSGQINPERTLRYVDEQIGRFYDELRDRDFFANGVLLILGDHRTMTPLTEDEFRQHGDRAFARIPLVVAGAVEMPRVVEDAFQQVDLRPSLQWLLGESACVGPFVGNFLRADPQPPNYVTHVRGDDRNRVDIYHTGSAVSGFRLDGDDSTWISEPPADAENVSAWIAVQRQDAAERASKKSEATRTLD
jgi:lipoteichoic acid synthase